MEFSDGDLADPELPEVLQEMEPLLWAFVQAVEVLQVMERQQAGQELLVLCSYNGVIEKGEIMNNVSSVVESQIKVLANQFISLMNQSANIVKNYTSTNAESLIGGLATPQTPATVSTALNQYQFEAGITFCTQVGNFFGGTSVTPADYLGICQNLLSGNTPASVALSPGVETLGNEMFSVAQNIVTFYQGAVLTNAAYNQNGLAQTIAAIGSGVVVPGCSTTAGLYTNGITMVVQFLNLLTNQSVFAESYLNVAVQWTQS
jgi:hypothetical protein